MKTSDQFAMFGLVLAVAIGLFAAKPASPTVAPVPQVAINSNAVAVASCLTGFPKQAKQLSAFYGQFSKVLKADAANRKSLSTIGQFHEAHVTALKVFVESDLYAGAPPIGDKIGAYLAQSLGGKSGAEIDDQAFANVQVALCAALDDLSNALAQVK